MIVGKKLISKKSGKVLARGSKTYLKKREKQIVFFKNLAARKRHGKKPFVKLRTKAAKRAYARG